eukprot:587750-Amphidinium_carterae.1
MDLSVQSMSLNGALCSAALIALGAIMVSQNVMSEISQINKSVIKNAIKFSTNIRAQRVKRLRTRSRMALKLSSSINQEQTIKLNERKKINMVAKQVSIKGITRAQISAIRLNVKDFLFLSIEEPRLTHILRPCKPY